MNVQRQTNTFIGGMNMDFDYSLMKSNQYQYAENIRILSNDDGSGGVMQNIEGFIKCNPSLLLADETIIHVDTIRDWAIVFTKTNQNKFNIYRFDFTKSEVEPQVAKIISDKEINILPTENGIYAISSVCRWESDENVKIYWTDGHSQIKILNVDAAHDNANQTISPDAMDIIPKGTLPQLKLKGYGTGALSTGKYQYAYQLFNPRSLETSVSALSKMFTVYRKQDANKTPDIQGDSVEANSGKSIRIETVLETTDFTRAKIIRLYYKNNKDIPEIHIIDDVQVSSNLLTFEDRGGTLLNELTVDEFNALVSYKFIPKILEAKDNILFAANIKEDTWDITPEEYDARAYRCDTSGNIALISNTGQDTLSFPVEDINIFKVPIDHDCICPFNTDSESNYRYLKNSQGKSILGGQGKNISYEFIIADLIEDDAPVDTSKGYTEDFNLSSSKVDTNRIPLYTIDDSFGFRTKAGEIVLPTGNNILNYANPYVDSYLRSYQRDEIYRFAIVFYNDSGMASSAHWIADIKIPEAQYFGYHIFSTGKVNLGSSETGVNSVVTHPLGIKFTVNVPEGVTGYEIVRCERTLADRSILAQGIVSGVTTGDSTKTQELYPYPYLAYTTEHGYVSESSKYSAVFTLSENTASEHFVFVSPEIAINKDNYQEIVDLYNTIIPIYSLYSPINSTIGTATDTVKVLANAKSIKSDGRIIHNVSDLDYNKNNGFVWTYKYPIINVTVKNLIKIDAGNFYTATLAKYYKKILSNKGGATIDVARIAVDTDPFDIPDEAWRTKPTSIGDKIYYNWSHYAHSTKGDQNNVQKIGPHGPCVVFQSRDMLNGIPRIKTKDNPEAVNAVMLCNIKQNVNPYGGSSYAARQNSVYIPTGTYQKANESTAFCYGGDTYIGVFDYANNMFAYKPDEYDADDEHSGRLNRTYNGAYFPCESSINLSLRSDNVQTSKTYDPASGYSNHFVQTNITQIGDLYSQTVPLYAYNDAYSAQPRAKEFVSRSMYSIDDLLTDTRVINSQPKTNNEVTDSWTKFKVANYIDVDNRFGSINNMMLFKNNLMYWQDDAFGTLSVNERSLITDNNLGSLTLGTGGVLARFDYITTKSGLKRNQLKAATQSDSTVYWYDEDRSELCAFGGSIETLSKLKGVQSYLHDKDITFSNDPSLVYDKKYNETLFTLEGKTLAFNEQIGVMTSFYTFKPNWYVEFADKLYTFNNLKLFKYNSGDESNLYTGEDKTAYIRFIINENYPQTKTFDNVEYGGNFTDRTNFEHIYFETKRQTSFSLATKDIDYREDTYKFAIPRNSIELSNTQQVANKSYRDRMKGKYLICHYKYDSNNGNTFQVPYISTSYRHSMI